MRACLRGRWRQAARVVMVQLSLQGLSAAQIAVLMECHPATVRRWIGRFNREGMAGLADRPRPGRPRLGGERLTSRIAAQFCICVIRRRWGGAAAAGGRAG